MWVAYRSNGHFCRFMSPRDTPDGDFTADNLANARKFSLLGDVACFFDATPEIDTNTENGDLVRFGKLRDTDILIHSLQNGSLDSLARSMAQHFQREVELREGPNGKLT